MRAAWNVLIAGFLLVQLALPLRGLLLDKYQTRGDFSWNMYSQHYRCSVRYEQLLPDGTAHELDVRAAFPRRDKASHVVHRDTLPRFHTWLCREAELRTAGRGARLRARVACRLNERPEALLVDPGRELCPATRAAAEP